MCIFSMKFLLPMCMWLWFVYWCWFVAYIIPWTWCKCWERERERGEKMRFGKLLGKHFVHCIGYWHLSLCDRHKMNIDTMLSAAKYRVSVSVCEWDRTIVIVIAHSADIVRWFASFCIMLLCVCYAGNSGDVMFQCFNACPNGLNANTGNCVHTFYA